MLKKNWIYETDDANYGNVDVWRFVKPNEYGKYVGDCEDYSFTWLALEKGSVAKAVWALMTGEAKIWYVYTHTGEGHAVMEYRGQFVDNWAGFLVSQEYMEKLGHKFQFVYPRPSVALHLLRGAFYTPQK